MLRMFKPKKLEKIELYNPSNGEVIPIEKVNDEVFSNKMMGDGYAVIPTSSEVYSPLKGEIISVFPTKHAITIKTPEGLEVILHMGVDTVELEGVPFEIYVSEGEIIDRSTKIASMNLSYLEEHGKSNDIIVALTNISNFGEMELSEVGNTKSSQVIGVITLKDK